MTRLHYVKKARKAIKGTDIKKGDSYYWWQFAFRSKQVSKTQPRRSQYLTQSEHLGAIYDLEDNLSELTTQQIVDGFSIDDIISEIENIRDTCQERFDNIPEQLQYAPAGEALQGYIDNLDQWQSDLESIDLDIDKTELRSQAQSEYEEALENCRTATLEDPAEEPDETEEEIYDRLLEERAQEILDELQNCSYPG